MSTRTEFFRRTLVGVAVLLLHPAAEVIAARTQSTEAGSVFARPAFSDLNDDLPSWIDFGGEFRFRFEGRQGLGYLAGNHDAYGLFRLRLNVDLTPTPWLEVFVQGQDSRAPGIRPASANGVFRDPADLRQAWVRIGGPEAGPVSLTVGRQLLLFGDQRLVGPLDWTNTARTWDAVRLEVRPVSGMRFDVFSSSVVRNDPGLEIDRSPEGNNLHGVYGSIGQVLPEATIEPFVMWRTNPRVTGENGVPGDLDRYSAGARVAGRLPDGFDYAGTLVEQWGSFAGGDIRARAWSALVGRTFQVPMSPRVFVEYNFASGDEDSSDGEIGWFDDIYPTAHLYYGYNDLIGWRNIRNLRIGATAQTFPRLRFAVDYHAFWLADAHDDLYNAAGAVTVVSPAAGAAETRVGDEIDVTVSSPLTSTITVGGGIGHLFAGPYLEAWSQGDGNTFSYCFASTRF